MKPYVVSTNEVISSTAPTATKMSSPKKAPTLSVLAAKARIRWTTASGSGAVLADGRGLGHRGDQRPHGLGVPADAHQADGRE